jgi:hypothetical protein
MDSEQEGTLGWRGERLASGPGLRPAPEFDLSQELRISMRARLGGLKEIKGQRYDRAPFGTEGVDTAV